MYLLQAGELALEEHCRTGPAVDAQVYEARLVHRLLPYTVRTGRLEETVHPDSAGDATGLAGLEDTFQSCVRLILSQRWSMFNCQKPNVHLQAGVSHLQFVVPAVTTISSRHEGQSEAVFMTEEHPMSTIPRTGIKKEKQPTVSPPWRDSDRSPKDTVRFNYLDNKDLVDQTLTG